MVLVIGAAGRTGEQIVRTAIGHGHDVRALVHKRPLAFSHPQLEVVSGDARDEETVVSAVRGSEGVAVAVGGERGVHEAVAANVLYAMAAGGVYRLAMLSAGGVFARDDRRISLAFRMQIATRLRALYDDLEQAERLVMASGLDWTIVRPSRLVDSAPTGHYRLSLTGEILDKPRDISRADVAAVMVKALETDLYRRRAIYVAG